MRRCVLLACVLLFPACCVLFVVCGPLVVVCSCVLIVVCFVFMDCVVSFAAWLLFFWCLFVVVRCVRFGGCVVFSFFVACWSSVVGCWL